MRLEQDEPAHSCAFCQRLVIDCSEENGGISATRRQMLDRFLLRAGLEGPGVSHPEEYEEERSKLYADLANANLILLDIAPLDLRSPAAKDCVLAKDLDHALNQITPFVPWTSLFIDAMLLAKLDLGSRTPGAKGAHLDLLLYDRRRACPKRSRPGRPIPDYWTRPWAFKSYFAAAEEGV